MSALLSLLWIFLGVFFTIAGRAFIEVAICFLIGGIFAGAAEIYVFRKEFEEFDKKLNEKFDREEKDGSM